MKKILAFFGIILLTISMPLSAKAAPARLVDDAGLLTAQEAAEVLNELDSVSNDIGMDVVVVTVPSLNGREVNDYTISLHDQSGYGMGEDNNCTMLLICPESRDYCIRGFGYKYFSDSVFEDIADSLYLSNEDYHYSFMTFASEVKYQYEIASMNGGRGPFEGMKKLGIALVIGLIVAGAYLLSLKNQLKSVRRQSGAADYTRSGSFNLETSRDHFLYSQITKTEIPKNDSSSSSSGSSYGGTSGKY